ncbi:regulator of competence-specific genes [Spongiibacter sp. IMCC21906]|jgi:DNA transformation protein|uniref:TfoX/Sxy family protein n=1 Tax=Spongiibacter sp. IMCC21906 TaxID=1620392 RepID=UPI00062DCFB1|nr:TfoX/Sxy family protein [Spongiibacter sp. IMCC21906]AKH70125.1 regulator of competence-specific genes [Spongiibacter sp. IMCC21906]
MSSTADFINYLQEQFQLIGPVEARRMFGGHGFFLDGLMFAITFDDCLYLKVDEVSKADFEAQGLAPFSYPRGDKMINLSYYQAPETIIDEPAELCEWGNRAFAAALYGRRKR